VIAPTRRLCVLALVPLVPTFALFVQPAFWPVVVLADFLIVAVAAADLASIPRQRAISIRRELQPIATRGALHPVTLRVNNESTRGIELSLVDDRPASIEIPAPLAAVFVPASGCCRVTSEVLPTERGRAYFEWVFTRCQSRLRLWTAVWRFSVPGELRVHPALKQIGRYALYARANRMSLLGVRRARQLGGDNEFESLREYTSDDQYRAIDWRATARRRKLTVRQFQANQSQRIVFAVDCGRMMVNRTEGETLFDAALDAALTLSHVALTQRDMAGLLCYDETVCRWLPPRGGRRHLNRMIVATHDVPVRLVESRIDLALNHLRGHCRQRTLFVIFTNVIDDRNAERIRSHLKAVVGRHLPLVVLLRDSALMAAVEPGVRRESPGDGPVHPAHAGAAAEILLWRRQVLQSLEADGILTLDVHPNQLTPSLINEYLAIKARHLL